MKCGHFHYYKKAWLPLLGFRTCSEHTHSCACCSEQLDPWCKGRQPSYTESSALVFAWHNRKCLATLCTHRLVSALSLTLSAAFPCHSVFLGRMPWIHEECSLSKIQSRYCYLEKECQTEKGRKALENPHVPGCALWVFTSDFFCFVLFLRRGLI